MNITTHFDMNMNVDITPPPHPMPGLSADRAGEGSWGSDINIHTDININIDMHIINMNIKSYIKYYLL